MDIRQRFSLPARKMACGCSCLRVCTHVCVDNSHGDVHTGIRVWHMMPHAQLAGSVAAFARLSGDLHACLRKTQKGLGVHCMQLADTGSVMLLFLLYRLCACLWP